MEEWKEELLKKALRDKDRAIQSKTESYEQALEKIAKAYKLKTRIIGALREPPEWIFGDTGVWISTPNHLLVHDVAKELGIELERSVEADGFNFRADVEGIHINVYGMQEVPHCKIVRHKEMRETWVYEEVCNEEEE